LPAGFKEEGVRRAHKAFHEGSGRGRKELRNDEILNFIKAALKRTLHDNNVRVGMKMTILPVTKLDEAVDAKWMERNARNAEQIVGIPAELWTEASRTLRMEFGYEKVIEAFFLAGFTVGWVERGAKEGKPEPRGAA